MYHAKHTQSDDLVLGSVQACFLEVGAYMSLKRATTGL